MFHILAFHILAGTGYLIIWLWKVEFKLDWDHDKHPLDRSLTIRWDPD